MTVLKCSLKKVLIMEWKFASDIWQQLKSQNRPLVIYGMGLGAEKVMVQLKRIGMSASAVFASDDFVRGHRFCGFDVLTLEQIKAVFDNFIILLSFASSLPEVMAQIYTLSEETELVAPALPVAGTQLFDTAYAKQHEKQIDAAYSLMADEFSKKTFEHLISYMLDGRIEHFKAIDCEKSEGYALLELEPGEHYADLGAYNGDTIRELISAAGMPDSIIAVEPDKKNFAKLVRMLENEGIENATVFNCGVYSEKAAIRFSQKSGRHSSASDSAPVYTSNNLNSDSFCPMDSLDNMAAGRKVTIIKMDVEGAETQALLGAKETIRAQKPKLIVSGYHRAEDIFTLPLLIKELHPDYRIFLRKHPYIPAWDFNFYCK